MEAETLPRGEMSCLTDFKKINKYWTPTGRGVVDLHKSHTHITALGVAALLMTL